MKSAFKPALRAGFILMGVFAAVAQAREGFAFDDARPTATAAVASTVSPIDTASITSVPVNFPRDRVVQLCLDPIETSELMAGASIIADTERITIDFDGGRKIHPRQTRGHG